LIIKNITPFSPKQIFECGQCFRWDLQDDGSYFGIAGGHIAKISYEEGNVNIDTDYEDEAFWRTYLDIDRDYNGIIKYLSNDAVMKEAISKGSGIRLLKQDKWEALCSFIISQNNNIPRIKGIISRLCEHYGGFPTYSQLSKETPESLSFLRAGFRAKYLVDASQKLESGQLSLEEISKTDIETARKMLMTIKGVGPKVAECALLYGMYRTEAFPVDVWI